MYSESDNASLLLRLLIAVLGRSNVYFASHTKRSLTYNMAACTLVTMDRELSDVTAPCL